MSVAIDCRKRLKRLLELRAKMRTQRLTIIRKEAEKANLDRELVALREKLAGNNRDLLKLLKDLDIYSSGNAGYEQRVVLLWLKIAGLIQEGAGSASAKNG